MVWAGLIFLPQSPKRRDTGHPPCRDEGSEVDGVVLGREWRGLLCGIAECHDGAAGVCKNAVDSAIVREVVHDGAGG